MVVLDFLFHMVLYFGGDIAKYAAALERAEFFGHAAGFTLLGSGENFLVLAEGAWDMRNGRAFRTIMLKEREYSVLAERGAVDLADAGIVRINVQDVISRGAVVRAIEGITILE